MRGKKRIAAVFLVIVALLVNTYIVYTMLLKDSEVGTAGIIYRIGVCLAFDAVIVFSIINIETFFRVPLDIYRSRDMFWDMAKNDFQAKFAGSVFGIFWAFVNPVITMLLYWFVFQVGFRSGDVGGYPFILYFMSGMIPWFYFQDALNGGTGVLVEYSYLVKKLVFNVGILPVLKVFSALFVHVFFLGFLMIVCAIYGFTPTLYTLQIFYYIICSAFLVLGLSYFTAACTVFFKDMTQLIGIVLMIGTWLTPIMWEPRRILSPGLMKVFEFNPMFYVVDGFRDALLYHKWFWEKPIWTVYFWAVAILIYIVGVKFFNRLKVHFSDVL